MRLEDEMKRKRTIIQDDMLIREIPIGVSDGEVISIERECIITKDEFIACYNKWVKEACNDQKDMDEDAK